MATSRDLYNAVMDGDVGTFKRLVEAAAASSDVTEKERWNYLHYALLNMRESPPPDMVRRLIAWGVDVNGVDMYGNTPLHYAARMTAPGAPEVIGLLVSAGARLETLNRDRLTPLRTALGNPRTFRALLEAGADLDQRNPGGASIREMVELYAKPEMKALVAELAGRDGS